MRRVHLISGGSTELYDGLKGGREVLKHHQLPEPRILLAIGGSAFQAPTDEETAVGRDPLVMRGYILAWAHRIEGNEPTAQPATSSTRKVPKGVAIRQRKYLMQLLDYSAGKQQPCLPRRLVISVA